jgi:hypothetical protein
MLSTTLHNRHQRRFATDPKAVGALLDQLGQPDDALWPRTRWPAIRLSRPVTAGQPSGHGAIRYSVDEYRPGEALWFRFDPASGLDGRHGFTVDPQPDGTVALTHTLNATTAGSGRLTWALVIRAMHDQLLEELLDNAETLLPGTVRPPSPQDLRGQNGPSRWGRVLRASFAGVNRLRSVPKPVALTTAVVGLGGAAALHATWALGGNWPGVDRTDLARKVVGTVTFPSDAATWVVVGLLIAAATLAVAGQTRPTESRLSSLITTGLGIVAAALGLRAILGFATSTVRLLADQRAPFVPRDLLIYSPLCAVLAVATAAIAIQRTPNPMEQ